MSDIKKNWATYLAVISATLWVGSMWAIGYIAAPVLFQSLPDKTLAGMLAGRMFAVTAWLGMGCAAYLLVFVWLKQGIRVWRSGMFWLILVMLAMLLVGHFGLQPLLADLKQQALPQYVMDSSYAGRFRLWHGISSVLYLAESLCGAGLLLKLYRCRQ